MSRFSNLKAKAQKGIGKAKAGTQKALKTSKTKLIEAKETVSSTIRVVSDSVSSPGEFPEIFPEIALTELCVAEFRSLCAFNEDFVVGYSYITPFRICFTYSKNSERSDLLIPFIQLKEVRPTHAKKKEGKWKIKKKGEANCILLIHSSGARYAFFNIHQYVLIWNSIILQFNNSRQLLFQQETMMLMNQQQQIQQQQQLSTTTTT